MKLTTLNKPYLLTDLFLKTIFSLIICSGLIIFCYYFVDRPVATFIFDHHFNQIFILKYMSLKYMTYISPALEYPVPIVIIYLILRMTFGMLAPFERMLFCICLTLPLAVAIKRFLKIVFGRYWPLTWTHHNPSWIGSGDYGFHFFHYGSWYQSFPSGHTTVVFTVMTIVWLVYPKWRMVSVLCCLMVVAGLLGMNYHFVSDIIAGSFLGAIIGTYAVRLGLRDIR